jgi:hypothetical protein
MKSSLASAVVLCLSFGLVACEGSAASTAACASPQDVAHKVTALTDDLNAARATGKIDPAKAGEIAAAMMTAGRSKDARSYCTALDKVRADSGL